MQDHSKLPASASKTESLSTTSVSIVGASGSRHGLIICPPSSGTATLMTDSAVTINQGFQISAGDPPLGFCRCQYGDMVTRPWFAISNDGQGPIGRSASDYWKANSTGTNTDIGATHTGVAGFRHVCTSIVMSYNTEIAAGFAGLILDGGNTIWRTFLNGRSQTNWTDDQGLMGTDGSDLTAYLFAGGAGVQGSAWLQGFTVPSPTITYYELGELNDRGTPGGNRPPQY